MTTASYGLEKFFAIKSSSCKSQCWTLISCLPCLVLKVSWHWKFPSSNLSKDFSILTIREPPCCPGLHHFWCSHRGVKGRFVCRFVCVCLLAHTWAVLHFPRLTCGSRGFWPLCTLTQQAWNRLGSVASYCSASSLEISLLLHTCS